MTSYRVVHTHQADECPAVYASWKGHTSPFRGRSAVSSCLAGGHEIWFDLEVDSTAEALALLPRYVAERSVAARINEVSIP